MAFVKVVGGSEIYNFRIQGFAHFYSKNWSFSSSNTGTSTRCRPESRHAFPMRRTPRLLGVFPGPCALPPAPYRPGARHGPPVRGGTPPYAHRPRLSYHNGISVVTAMSPVSPINAARFPPRVNTADPPCHQRRRRAAPPPPLFPTAEQPSLPLP
jgi:hypothetical protein